MATVDHLSASDLEPLNAHERAVVAVAAELQANVDAASVAALIRDGGEALECVRDGLDPQLLVQVALDALVCAHIRDRRVARA